MSAEYVQLDKLIHAVSGRAGQDTSLPVYSVTKHRGFVPSAEYFKKQVFAKDLSSYKIVEPDQFAYATIHLDEGSIGFAPEKCLVSPMYTVFGVDYSRVDRDYLFAFLKSDRAIKSYEALGRGSAERRRAISLDALGRLLVPLPPLLEQRRIASILENAKSIERLVASRAKMTDELAMSLFIGRFGRALEWPSRWSSARLDEIAETRLGKMLDKSRQASLQQWPYLRNANVQWMRFDLDDIQTMGLDVEDRAEFSLEVGDVLVCEGGEPGRSAVWKGELNNIYFQKALHRVRLDKGVMLPEFFVWVMREMAVSGRLADNITSATIAHLTGVKLKGLQLPVPNINEQRAFVEELEALQTLKDKNDEAITTIRQLASSLRSRAFRGEP